MPFLAPALAGLGGLIGGGTGAGAALAGTIGASTAGGALANRSQKRTSTQTVTPTLSPELQAFQSEILGRLRDRLANPSAGLDPLKSAAIQKTNQSFADAGDRATSALVGRGFGRSGKLVRNQNNIELARGGALADLESQFAKFSLDREQDTLGLSERLLSSQAGRTSTGEETIPGNVAGGAFASGGSALGSLSSLISLSQLSKLLQGGR